MTSIKTPWWKYRRLPQLPTIAWNADRAEELFWGLFKFLYFTVSFLIGVAAFLVAWSYAVTTYGLFLGIGLGIFPSFVIGCVAAVLWPIVLFMWYKYPAFMAQLHLM